MIDIVINTYIDDLYIYRTLFPGCIEEYRIQLIEGGYRVTKTSGFGISTGIPNNYQIDLDALQADEMFYKLRKVSKAICCNNKEHIQDSPSSNWKITVKFVDGMVKEVEGYDRFGETTESLIKILKSTIRRII